MKAVTDNKALLKRKAGFCLAAGLLAWGGAAQAAPASGAPYAVVEAVQSPAWVERNAKRVPLSPGMELHNHDHLVTGAGARAIIDLSDGSSVKLGENARVGVNALGQREGGVFTAALDVVTGAFRLTTDIFRKYQSKRAINVRVGTVTAGIRGTDIWGRSDAERDFICLLEGRIVTSHPDGEPAELNEPLQHYGANKGQPPGPVSKVERTEAILWAIQTELQHGVGTARRGGQWGVLLTTLESEDEARAMYARVGTRGHAGRIRPGQGAEGGYRYELRVSQLADEPEAQQLAARIGRELSLAAPVVLKPRR